MIRKIVHVVDGLNRGRSKAGRQPQVQLQARRFDLHLVFDVLVLDGLGPFQASWQPMSLALRPPLVLCCPQAPGTRLRDAPLIDRAIIQPLDFERLLKRLTMF